MIIGIFVRFYIQVLFTLAMRRLARLWTQLLLLVVVCIVILISQHKQFTNVPQRPPVSSDHAVDLSKYLNITNTSLFPTKQLVIWSNDYHISPTNDIKHLLKPLGVKVIDKNLSGYCKFANTCGGKNTLRVIKEDNALNLDPALIPKFYDSYKNDSEMLSVDAFVCFHPSAMCELFEPFNRSLLVIPSTRYEIGRFAPDRWARWNDNLMRMSNNPRNVIGANNLYDAEYLRYFTGVRPLVIPSYCGYLNDKYEATRPGFILSPSRNVGFTNLFSKMRDESCRKVNCTVELIPLRSRYPHYAYSDLAAHQGIVYVPYQVSVMSMFEQYRMNIPLFFPSFDLLAAWQHEHMVSYWKQFYLQNFTSQPEQSIYRPTDHMGLNNISQSNHAIVIHHNVALTS